MAIEDRNLKVGMKLVARYKGQDYACIVMEGDDKGGLRFMLDDLDDNRLSSMVCKSLSSAGSEIMGGIACNGWRFWSIEGQEPKQKKARKANPKTKGFKRLEDGRFFCDACMEPFDAPKDVTPQGCPKGHSPDGGNKAAKPKKETATA